ncbi:MAG: SH3 domain-containing protein [Pseudomonadota bacterium]
MKLFWFATLLIGAGNANALEFKSIGSVPAILYDAPSQKGVKVFVAPRGMPLEVIFTYGEWTKVRDASGDLSWIEAKSLSSKHTVVVTAANLKVRSSAEDGSAPVFIADKGLLLDLAEPVASGWVKVKHRDGLAGYVKTTEVWGD